MKLTENFTLEEMTKNRHNVPNIPNAKSIAALKLLCENVLQPLRTMYGKPITVNSGYRGLQVNKLAGGAVGSQHLKGEAADISAGSKAENKKLFEIIEKCLIFDQLINEKDYTWIHVSHKQFGNRGMKLKFNGSKYVRI